MADDGSGQERSDNPAHQTFIHSPFIFQRILLLICAISISAPVIYKSRPGRENPARSAFSVLTSSRGYVRISGEVRNEGMYPISANLMTMSAIKMAGPRSSGVAELTEGDAAANLVNGMALHVASLPKGVLLLTKSQIGTNERLVMGVPLDINTMTEANFDSVPGIGPQMAKRIVQHRQNNGGSMQVIDLLSVEGIGEKKYKQLLKYF